MCDLVKEGYLLRDVSDSEDSFSSGSDVPAILPCAAGASQSDSKLSGDDKQEHIKTPPVSSVEEDQQQKEQVIKMAVSSSGEISTNTEINKSKFPAMTVIIV